MQVMWRYDWRRLTQHVAAMWACGQHSHVTKAESASKNRAMHAASWPGSPTLTAQRALAAPSQRALPQDPSYMSMYTRLLIALFFEARRPALSEWQRTYFDFCWQCQWGGGKVRRWRLQTKIV